MHGFWELARKLAELGNIKVTRIMIQGICRWIHAKDLEKKTKGKTVSLTNQSSETAYPSSFLEPQSGFEPETSSLPRTRSTCWAIAAYSVFMHHLYNRPHPYQSRIRTPSHVLICSHTQYTRIDAKLQLHYRGLPARHNFWVTLILLAEKLAAAKNKKLLARDEVNGFWPLTYRIDGDTADGAVSPSIFIFTKGV